jgi:hypothetical protein
MIDANSDWSSAPKDGSVINVAFRDPPHARARWNSDKGRWDVLSSTGSGVWIDMEYSRGVSKPILWWR